MPDTRPEPESRPDVAHAWPEDEDWDGPAFTPAAPDPTANLVGGTARLRSQVGSPFLVLGVVVLALLVAMLGFIVVESPFSSARSTRIQLGASVATYGAPQVAPAGSSIAAPNATAVLGGKTRLEDVLVSGGCRISPSCPASVSYATFAPVTQGIKISAGTPVILRLDGRYHVLRAALYIDGNSTAGGTFSMKDVSDPQLPLNDGAIVFNAAAQGSFQLPIAQQAQQIALSVDSGTIDLVGYVEGQGY
jgi:hypothetical protein